MHCSVFNQLMVSSLEDIESLSEETMQALRINTVISIGCSVKSPHYSLRYLVFSAIQDSLNVYLIEFWLYLIDSISSSSKQDIIPWIHCVYGQSRSIATAVAYLLLSPTNDNTSRKIPFLIQAIKEIKPDISINPSFISQLLLLEQINSLVNSSILIDSISSSSSSLSLSLINADLLDETTCNLLNTYYLLNYSYPLSQYCDDSNCNISSSSAAVKLPLLAYLQHYHHIIIHTFHEQTHTIESSNDSLSPPCRQRAILCKSCKCLLASDLHLIAQGCLNDQGQQVDQLVDDYWRPMWTSSSSASVNNKGPLSLPIKGLLAMAPLSWMQQQVIQHSNTGPFTIELTCPQCQHPVGEWRKQSVDVCNNQFLLADLFALKGNCVILQRKKL